MDLGANQALIGLERTFLDPKYDELARMLFIHELCHLSVVGHDEEFNDRFSEILIFYEIAAAEAEMEEQSE